MQCASLNDSIFSAHCHTQRAQVGPRRLVRALLPEGPVLVKLEKGERALPVPQRIFTCTCFECRYYGPDLIAS